MALGMIQRKSKPNHELQSPVHFPRTDWPRNIIDDCRLQLYHRKDFLTIVDDRAMLPDHIVIANWLKFRVPKEITNDHPSITCPKATAWSFVHRAGIDKHIEEYVLRWKKCPLAANRWPISTGPCERVQINFVIVDTYSRLTKYFSKYHCVSQ